MNGKKKSFVSAIILAAGEGSRMKADITKQKMDICGKSILWHTVSRFCECDLVNSVIIVCRPEETEWVRSEVNGLAKIDGIVIGGGTRAESARIGFENVRGESDLVAIHDCARCLVTVQNITDVISAAVQFGAATAATPLTDTLKSVDKDRIIDKTLPRDGMWLAQTPQVFAYDLYKSALENRVDISGVTDDNMLVEMIGGEVYAVDCGRENIKITLPSDIRYAEFIMQRRKAMNEIRVGHGYDVHRLIDGRRLVLGGVEIPFDRGLLGHSDADVLLHAVMDALLGACGMGDIGRHFPDTSEEFKDISSLLLLRRVGSLICEAGYSIVNIDATVILQKPRIAPYIDDMVSNIAEVLKIESGRINVKATTEEGLGFTGCEEGVSAHAVALVGKRQ